MTRFKSVFAELMSFKNLDQTEQYFPELPTLVEPPTQKELESKQETVDALVRLRFKGEDNDFLRITEMSSFQKFDLYVDSMPLFKLRMKLWRVYMYGFLT